MGKGDPESVCLYKIIIGIAKPPALIKPWNVPLNCGKYLICPLKDVYLPLLNITTQEIPNIHCYIYTNKKS